MVGPAALVAFVLAVFDAVRIRGLESRVGALEEAARLRARAVFDASVRDQAPGRRPASGGR